MIGDIIKIGGLIGGGILGVLLLLAFMVILGGLFYGWIIMLVVGMLWHEFGILTPIGMFPVSFGFGILLSLILGILGGNSKT